MDSQYNDQLVGWLRGRKKIGSLGMEAGRAIRSGTQATNGGVGDGPEALGIA